MLTDIHPKLPMRSKEVTKDFYQKLGFQNLGNTDYDDYLMLKKDHIQIHFFEFRALNPAENYGQVYIRTDDIDALYRDMLARGLSIHPAGTWRPNHGGRGSFPCLIPTTICLRLGRRNNYPRIDKGTGCLLNFKSISIRGG